MDGAAGGTVTHPRARTHASRAVVAALAVAVLAAFFLVDTRAEAAFDAPKRAAVLTLVALAGAAALAVSDPTRTPRPWRALPGPCRLSAGLLGVVAAMALLATLLSPRRGVALDALRVLLLLATLLPLGASRALGARGARILLAVYIGAAVASAALALLQAGGLWQPVTVAAVTGRSSAFALVGNEGVLALALALAGVAALGVALSATGGTRAAAVAAAVLLAAGIAATHVLTALVALLAGAATLLLLAARHRRRAALAAVLAAALGVAALPPVTARLRAAAADLQSGRIGPLTSDRLGAWAAAAEMVRARPLVGFGPGTFAAEFAPHRVSAELRFGRSLVHQKITGSFAEVHSEPLQAAAELGAPAALAAAGALAALLVGLWGLAGTREGPARTEVLIALAMLLAGTFASLLWFPLQREVTALPLLLAAGRGWRLIAGDVG